MEEEETTTKIPTPPTTSQGAPRNSLSSRPVGIAPAAAAVKGQTRPAGLSRTSSGAVMQQPAQVKPSSVPAVPVPAAAASQARCGTNRSAGDGNSTEKLRKAFKPPTIKNVAKANAQKEAWKIKGPPVTAKQLEGAELEAFTMDDWEGDMSF